MEIIDDIISLKRYQIYIYTGGDACTYFHTHNSKYTLTCNWVINDMIYDII